VLPLWRKEVRIVLCPDKVIIVAFAKGLWRKIVSQAILPVAPQNSADWRSALTSLERWIAENELGKADIKIHLSNCFVRFALMPFTEGVTDYAERLTVAGLLFESIYGESAKQWRLSLDETQYGEPCLVAAIDSGLAEAIDQLVSSRRFRSVSVQPYTASVLNAFGKQIQNGEGLFVVLDHGQAVLFDIREKKIAGTRKVMLGIAPDGDEISNTLRREILISGLNAENANIYLHIAGSAKLEVSPMPGVNVTTLKHISKNEHLGVGYEMTCVEDEQ
jgi:hypothetical protein